MFVNKRNIAVVMCFYVTYFPQLRGNNKLFDNILLCLHEGEIMVCNGVSLEMVSPGTVPLAEWIVPKVLFKGRLVLITPHLEIETVTLQTLYPGEVLQLHIEYFLMTLSTHCACLFNNSFSRKVSL